jgi:two-component system sensor histidine kinase ChiS
MKKNILIMIFLLQFCALFVPLLASANVENINNKDWQYRWGDSQFNENGIPLWTLNNTDDESNWLYLNNINDLEKKHWNSVWYKLKLENIACEKNCSIKVSQIYQNYDVYLDNTRIYNFGEMDHSDIVKVEGRSLGQINFDKGNSEYLYFRVHSALARIGLQGNIIIGEQAQVTREIIKANVIYFSLTIISLIVGLILIVISFLNRTKLSLIVGIFIFSMGEYIFTLSDIKYIFFPNQELLLYNLKIISEYVLSSLTFITYESFWGAGYKKINNIIWKLFLVQAVVYIIVAIGDVTEAQKLFIYYNFSVLVSFLYIFADALLKYLKYKNFEVKMILFAIFSITAACIHDVLRAILLFNANQIMPWGLCAYMIFMCAIIIKRIYNIHVELQKTNIRLDELNKQKDRIFANTSHELRTPLTGIIGLAESLLSESNEKMKNSLNIIISSGRRLSKLINDILDISNMNNNAAVLDLRPVNVFEVAESVIYLSKPLIGNKPVTIVNRISSTLVLADEDRLQQIFHNLLSNAIKFTDVGVIELSIQQDLDYATIFIKDKGIGIPIDKLEDIFLPFEQVDGSISRKYGGTGLGLFVTKQFSRIAWWNLGS